MNRATCVQVNYTSWQCQCRCGFTGIRCESTVYECANNPCMNGGTCTKPTPCGFVCVCPQKPITYYGPLCENQAPISPTDCIYSKKETIYFAGEQLTKLRFSDAMQNIYSAYNAENINNRNVCPQGFNLVGNSCYQVLADSLYNWHQARSQCDQTGSYLAWFTSPQDVDLVRSWLNGLSFTNDIWVGGKQTAGQWYWDYNDASISPNVLDSFWAPGRPGNSPTQSAMLMSRSSGFLFANQNPSIGQFSVLCKKDPFVFDNSNTMLVPVSQINAIDPSGRPLVGFQFLTNVTNSSSSITRVFSPTTGTYSTVFSQIPVVYGQYYSGPAYKYENPFKLVICGDLTALQIDQVKANIKSTWLLVRQDFYQCNCFDIVVLSVDKYTDVNNQISTMLTYIGRANQAIIESTTTGLVPTMAQIFNSLESIGFGQCVVRNSRSVLLDVVVANPSLAQPDYKTLQNSIRNSLVAVRPDLAANKSTVDVRIVSYNDLIDLSTKSAVTKVYLQITINDSIIDFYAQNDFDAQRLIDELNYQNENNSLYILKSNEIYSKNYFFTLISTCKVKKVHFVNLERAVLNVFLRKYEQFENRDVSVITTWQEEYVNEHRHILYGLSILISVDKQPVDNIINLDRNIFAKLESLEVSPDLTYSLSLPRLGTYLQPLAKANTFYSNILICRRDFEKVESLIRDVIEEIKPGIYDFFYDYEMSLLSPLSLLNLSPFEKLFYHFEKRVVPKISNKRNLKYENGIF